MTEEAKGRSGRPEFTPSALQREEVEILVAAQATQQAIANYIGVSLPTLRKHFADELEFGADRKNLKLIIARYRAAEGGSAAALNAWDARSPTRKAPKKSAQEPQPKPVELGKKAAERVAAQTAAEGTEFEKFLTH
jgi:hypothetical protein